MDFQRIQIERVNNGWIVRAWEKMGSGFGDFDGDEGSGKNGVFVEHTEEMVLSRINKLLRGSTC